MENYEDFIQRLSKSLADEDENDDEDAQPLIRPSSVIVFHRVRVLPPLLNEQQRDEMRHVRETVMSLMKRRQEKMSFIFKDETVTVQGSISDYMNEIDGVTQSKWTHPPTSTAHDGLPANQLRAFPEDASLENSQITVVFEGAGLRTHTPPDSHLDKHPHSDISCQTMMSSGYVTNENTDVKCDFSWMDGRGGAENIRTAAGLHLNITQSSRTGSDIISHVPVVGSVFEGQNAAVDVTEALNLPSAADADEGLYRTSLQNLLKKSQDYRRHQRLLRSQAKAFKPPDELSLSDKENQEFLLNQIWKTELRNARERRKVKMQLPDTDISMHTEPQETCADGEISKETCRSSDALTEQSDLSQPTSTQFPVTAGSLDLSRQKPMGGTRSSSAVGKRFLNIPLPTFCFSPVRSKKGLISAGPVRKAFCVEHDTESDCHGNIPGSLNDGGLLVDRSSEQTEQIAQLELNLSSLKAMITDLESTLTRSQTDPSGSPADNSSYMLKNQESSPDICLKQQELTTKDFGIRQKTRSPTVTYKIRLLNSVQMTGGSKHPPHRAGVLTDSSNRSEETKNSEEKQQLWVQGKPLSPEVGVSRVKRRLLMNEVDVCPRHDVERPRGLQTSVQTSVQPRGDQVRTLLEEERRQQQEILQSLAVRYQFLRSVSLLCPSTRSCLEDTSTPPHPSSASTHAVYTDHCHNHDTSPV